MYVAAGDLIALPLGASVLSVVFEIVPAHTLTDRWAPVMVLVATLNACVSPFIAAAAAAATGLPQEYALPCTLQGQGGTGGSDSMIVRPTLMIAKSDHSFLL